MRTENLTFTHKKKTYSATVVWPENLVEAFNLLGEKELWAAFKLGYLEITKRRIVNPTPRPRIRKIDLNRLTEEQAALIEHILADAQKPQAEQKSVQPEPQQTIQTDSYETQEVVQASVLSRDSSFEEDFARYSAALDSSLPRHTETAAQPLPKVEDPRQLSHWESP